MASGSSRARIDQFFASRKRKPPLVKGEKPDKESRSKTPDGSPSAKGTLDCFLAKSPGGGAGTSPSAVRPQTGHAGGSSRPELVKRNLSLDIGLSSDAAQEPILNSCPSQVQKEARGEAPADAIVMEQQGPAESSRGNLELKKFANDFLSLYCSELPSAVNFPAEQELKGQKRNISPSLLVAHNKTSMKKLCIVDCNVPTQEAVDAASIQVCAESAKPELDVKPTEGMAAPSGEHEGKVGKSFVDGDGVGTVCMGLRKCGTTPSSNLMKTGLYTAGGSCSAIYYGETPKSLSRRSMFSPGEEFWNEAIQVADGLLAPVEKLDIPLDEGHGAMEVQGRLLLQSGRSANKFSEDKSSFAVTRGPGNLSGSTNEDINAHNVARNGCLRPNETLIEETKESQAIQYIDASPLPVKHFDFSQEDNNLTENDSRLCLIKKAEAATTVRNEPADSSSVGEKCLQTLIILKPCEAKTSLEGKPNSSVRVSVDVSSGCLPSSTRSFPQTLCNASHLVVDESKGDALTEYCPLSEEKGLKNSGTSSGNHEEASTPSSFMLKDRLQLTSWLPSEVCSIYRKKGISKLYPWQVDCLLVDGVLVKRNLVYCASTSAGKSFVAEVLMLRQVISTGKMAILVLPYVSICAEKAEHLELLLEPLGKHVRSFYGNQGSGSLPKETSIAVCTIEKANSLINRLLEEGRLSELGIIVIDELHMVGDQNRGYLLELMLTKLRYAAGEGISETSSGESCGSSSSKTDPARGLQIVGMSATMPNVAAVADWLQAALYQTDFRPVPLEEYVKVGNTIFDKKLEVARMIPKTADLRGKDPDHIVELCNEVVQEGHSVLLFCSSRKGCESTARHVAKFLKKFEVGSRGAVCEYDDATSAIEALGRCPAGLDPVLQETLPSGVAYHHAGLTVEEREIIETCYRKGLVRVLTATSTLAAGVNLPARRVIFRQPRIGRDFIDGTRYRQMAGRAGRTGIDTKGESILICKPEEVKRIASILNDNCPPLQSCLAEDKNGMTHAILEVVAGGIVQTASDIHRYVRCTLLNSTKPFQDVVRSAQDSLRWLCHKKFIEWNEETRLYSTTPLGRASFGSSLSPEESLVVLDDLLRAREGFVLASDLHLVYLVTPINVDVEPDWELYYERFMELSVLDQSVGNRVGVAEPFLMRMAHGAPVPVQDKLRGRKNGVNGKIQTRSIADDNSMFWNEQTLRVSKRFFVALMLSKLVQEVPVADVCEAFKVARGMIQALQENAGRFAMMVSQFCERLGWHDLGGLVSKFQNRVSFGVRGEIVELTTIPYVKGSRARALYKAGLRTPLAIAEAPVPEIAKALFESSSWAAQEGSAMRRMQLGIAKKIKNGARKIILDQAEESRLSVFTTFRSLGIQVPQFSWPLLRTNAEESTAQGSGEVSSGDNAISCFDGTDTDEGNISAPPAGNGKAKRLNDTSHKIAAEKVIETANVSPEHVGVDRTGGMQNGCNITNPELCEEPASVDSSLPCILHKNNAETSGPSICPMVPAGSSGGILDERVQKEQCNGEENGSSYNNGDFSDKGPINACNVPGGFDSFLDKWDAVQEFCFDVHFTKRSELNSQVPFEMFGLAICWESSPVYYINFPKDLVPSGELNICGDVLTNSVNDINSIAAFSDMCEVIKHRWRRIAKIMRRNGVKKFTWNMKIQIQVLKIPSISIQRLRKPSVNYEKLNNIDLIEGSYLRLPSVSVHDGIDICLVAWILWPDEESKSSPNLERLVKKRLSNEAAAAANRDGRWRNQMRKAAHNGCCRRVAQIRALSSVLWKLLISENLVKELNEIENPLVEVLADMELWGIGVDLEACLQAKHVLMRKLKELEKEAYSLAGMCFSLYAAADIANVLFTRLNLQIPEGHNKGKQHPSTDKHALDLLRGRHPIISVIKEHRTLAKLLNSTMGSICSRARLCMKSQKYIIQGHWLQSSTATGRLSMEEPNLQCVEHAVAFTTHHSDGSHGNNTGCLNIDHHQINPRDFFIPTQDNWLLLTADYSQIELRLMAHFSKDSHLIELLSKSDGDVFTMIAARWTAKAKSTISSQQRDQTKRLVYGILYGMGANTLAEQLECSSEVAVEKIRSFKTSFPGVSAWLQEAVASCRRKGYVETLKGRKRFLSKIKFGNNKEKAKAQRQAVNSICQGSAADIIKIAMLNIHSVIAEGSEALTSNSGLATEFSMLKGHCRIILQVHDELMLEVDPCFVRQAGKLLQMSMESAVSLLVPLPVKLKVGKTWGSLEPLQTE